MYSYRLVPSRGPRRRRGSQLMSALACSCAATMVLAACGSSGGSGSSKGATAPTSTAASSSATGSAAAALLPAAIRSSGKLRVAVNLPNPPLEYQVNGAGAYTGFDIDLARALATDLGLTAAFSNLAFTALLTSLDTGRVDIVLSGLFDNAARQANYSIIDYLKTGTQVFTTPANASKVPSLESLCGQTVETAVGTAFIQQLAAYSKTLCAGKSPIKVLAVGSSFAEEVLQIKTARAVAAVATPENVAYTISTDPKSLVAIGKPFNQVPYGIDIPKANTGLRDALSKALGDLLANGTYAKIAAKYKLTNGAISSVVINGGK